MKIMYLLLAIIFIVVAYYFRMRRWKMFVEIYEKPNQQNLLRGISFGNILNFLLPYKLGDVFRGWYTGRKMKYKFALSYSTIILDRVLDIIIVGFFFIGFYIVGDRSIQKTALFYIGSMLLLLLLGGVVYFCKGIFKKLLKAIAGVFNENFEMYILEFAWSLIWNFKDIILKIDKLKLVLNTVGLWAFSCISYYFYAEYISVSNSIREKWIDVFIALFEKNSIQMGIIQTAGVQLDVRNLDFVGYMIIPSLIIILYTVIRKKNEATDIQKNYLNLLPHLDKKERLKFLETYFMDNKRDYLDNYYKINQSISIISDYSAGSNATTMLCTDGENTFFRKYAFGKDGDKLFEQISWIEKHQSTIPLPEIIIYKKDDTYCYYDMPYNNNALGLFNYAHSMPKDKAWNILRKTMELMEQTIYLQDFRKADKDTILNYVQTKVEKNLQIIMDNSRIKSLLEYETIIINGVSYKNLPYYLKYLTSEHLLEIFNEDNYSAIHGDLTIENIICLRQSTSEDAFFIIDPNTGNVHDSSNLDYAKILQSIHGSYEFLMTTKNVEVKENNIDFLFTSSSAYTYLYKQFKGYLEENYSYERVRSIYYHEIIHWLRLLPYKIEKNGKRMLLFYAGLLMVLNDVVDMFENLEEKRDI